MILYDLEFLSSVEVSSETEQIVEMVVHQTVHTFDFPEKALRWLFPRKLFSIGWFDGLLG